MRGLAALTGDSSGLSLSCKAGGVLALAAAAAAAALAGDEHPRAPAPAAVGVAGVLLLLTVWNAVLAPAGDLLLLLLLQAWSKA